MQYSKTLIYIEYQNDQGRSVKSPPPSSLPHNKPSQKSLATITLMLWCVVVIALCPWMCMCLVVRQRRRHCSTGSNKKVSLSCKQDLIISATSSVKVNSPKASTILPSPNSSISCAHRHSRAAFCGGVSFIIR
jgi:hypothetical protein